MTFAEGWYPNPIQDEASLAKGKYRYWDGTTWLPRYSVGLPTKNVPDGPPPPKPQPPSPPKVLADTSADMIGHGEWREARQQRPIRGRLLVIEESGARRLEFMMDGGYGLSPIKGSDIVRIVKVKSGFNTVVEVHYRGESARLTANWSERVCCTNG